MSNRTKTQIERTNRRNKNFTPFIPGMTTIKPYFSKYFHADPAKCMPRKQQEEKPESSKAGSYTAICSYAEFCGVNACKHAKPHTHDSSCVKHRPFNLGHTEASSAANDLMMQGIKIDRCGVCSAVNTTAADYIEAEIEQLKDIEVGE